LKLNLKKKPVIAISSSSSWSLWKFRKEFLEDLSKKNNIIILSKENFYLNNIKFKNFFLYIEHNTKLFLKNIILLKNKKISKIIEYDIKNLIFHLFLKIFLNYQLIVICAGLGSYYNKKGYFNLLEKFILWIIFQPVNKVIFINKYDQKILCRIVKKKSYIIQTEGYNLKFHKIKKKLNKKISFVLGARPIKEKGIIEYIEVAKQFPQFNFYLYLIGSNKNKIFYNSKNINFYELNIPKNLKIKINTKDFANRIKRYDCLISNSYGEGFGNTLAEAACAGIPIISTKTNGAKYIFKKKSLIWTEIKSIKSLKKAISKFIKLSKLERLTMINNARLDLLKIDSKIIIKKINQYL
jgi:glycosyltransferase involved in cell wall biosynthesis